MPATLSPIAAPHALQYAAQFGTSVIERAFLGATMGRSIRLEELAEHAPVLTPPAAAFYQQNCMVCFDLQRHASGVALNVAFADNEEDVAVEWSGEVTPDVHRSYLDREKRVDHGACAIALLLMPEFAGFVGVLTSAKGNGIDYYLADRNAGDDLIFNHAAVLEVSGIQEANDGNTVEGRIAAKRRRLKEYASSPTATTVDLPTYICVVEFGRPCAKVVLA